MNPATLVTVEKQSWMGAYSPTVAELYFNDGVFKHYLPQPDLAAKRKIMQAIALAWANLVDGNYSESNQPILISRILPRGDNKVELVLSQGIVLFDTRTIDLTSGQRNDKLTPKIDEEQRVIPLSRILNAPQATKGRDKTAKAALVAWEEDFEKQQEGFLASKDRQSRKTSSRLLQPPIESEPEAPKLSTLLTVDNYEANLALVDSHFADAPVRPSTISHLITDSKLEIGRQNALVQSELKDTGSTEDLLNALQATFKSSDHQSMTSLHIGYLQLRSEYGRQKQLLQKILAEDLSHGLKDCEEERVRLTKKLAEYDFGNDVVRLSYIKRSLVHAIYSAARDYYTSIWAEGARLSTESKRLDYLKEKFGEFNEKFAPFAFTVTDNYQLSPISQAYKLSQMELSDLERHIQEVLEHTNTTWLLSSTSNSHVRARLDKLQGEFTSQLGNPCHVISGKTIFKLTDEAKEIEANTAALAKCDLRGINKVKPLTSHALPGIIGELHRIEVGLRQLKAPLDNLTDLLAQKHILNSRRYPLVIDLGGLTEKIRVLKDKVSDATFLSDDERRLINDSHLEDLRERLRLAGIDHQDKVQSIGVLIGEFNTILRKHPIKEADLTDANLIVKKITKAEKELDEVVKDIRLTHDDVEAAYAQTKSILQRADACHDETRNIQTSFAVGDAITTDALTNREHHNNQVKRRIAAQKIPYRHQENLYLTVLESAFNKHADKSIDKIDRDVEKSNTVTLCNMALSSIFNLQYWESTTNLFQERRVVKETLPNGKTKNRSVPSVIAGLIEEAGKNPVCIHDHNHAVSMLEKIKASGLMFHNIESFDSIDNETLHVHLENNNFFGPEANRNTNALPLPKNGHGQRQATRLSVNDLNRFSVKPVKKPGFFKRHWKAMVIGGLLVAGAVAITIGTAGFGAPIGAGLVAAATAVGLGMSTAVGTGVGVGAAVVAGAAIGAATGACADVVANKYRSKKASRQIVVDVERQPLLDHDQLDIDDMLDEADSAIAELESRLANNEVGARRPMSPPIAIPGGSTRSVLNALSESPPQHHIGNPQQSLGASLHPRDEGDSVRSTNDDSFDIEAVRAIIDDADSFIAEFEGSQKQKDDTVTTSLARSPSH